MIDQSALSHFIIVFCRIAGLIMIFPALGSQRIPGRIKISLSVFIALLISPGLPSSGITIVNVPSIVLKESLIGISFGIASRIVFYAAETAGSIISMMIGLSNALGSTNEEAETLPILSTICSLVTTFVIVTADLHHLMIMGAKGSYDIVPINATLNMQVSLVSTVEAIQRSSVLALQISSPFIILGIIMNVTAGILNRIVQQVPIYFVLTPLVTFAGLVLLWVIFGSLVMMLSAALSQEFK